MRSRVLVVIVLSLAALAPACPPSPQPPTPDAADAGPPGSIYVEACAALAKADCLEGKRPTCAVLMQREQETRHEDFKPECLVSKSTKADMRKCSASITCP